MTEELKQIFRNDYIPKVSTPVQKDYKLTFTDDDESVIDNSHIVGDSLELYEVLCKAKYLDFGACESNELRITVFDVSEALDGREFKITMTVNSEEVELGYFTVISSKKQSDSWYRNLVCTDRMVKFDKDVSSWYEALEWPKTIAEIRASLCTECEVEEDTIPNLKNDSVSIEKTITAQNLTGRQMLRYLEQANGCFGTIGRNGKLQHIILNPTEGLYPKVTLFPVSSLYPNSEDMEANYKIPDGAVRSYVESEEYTCDDITKVQIKTTTNDVGCIVGEGDNCFVIEGNILFLGKSDEDLEEIATNILANVSKRIYRPLNATLLGLPDIEIGNDIAIISDDTTQYTYVMQRTLKGSQVLTDAIQSAGTKKLSKVLTTKHEITQLKSKTLEIIKSVDEISATIEDPENGLKAQIKANVDAILLRVEKDELCSEISLSDDKITLSGNRLIVNSTNFTLDGNGNATFSGDVTGATITGGTITSANGKFEVHDDGQMVLADGVAHATLTNGYYWIYSPSGSMVIYPNMLSIIDTTDSNTESGLDLTCSGATGSINLHGGNISCGSINNVPVSSYLASGSSIECTNDISASLRTSAYNDGELVTFGNTSANSDVACASYVQAYTAGASSDERIKKNIKQLGDVTEKYMKFVPIEYDWILKDDHAYGLGAHAVFDIDENLVRKNDIISKEQKELCKDDGVVWEVMYNHLHALHIKMIQKHELQIQDILNRLEAV